jgi:hypothetical protein
METSRTSGKDSRMMLPAAGNALPSGLRALYTKALTAIEDGKQLWSDRKKRLCLTMFQEVGSKSAVGVVRWGLLSWAERRALKPPGGRLLWLGARARPSLCRAEMNRDQVGGG